MNASEQAAHDALARCGYVVLRKGWPDFLVVSPTGGLFALEWKSRWDRVMPHQERMHDVLAFAGIPTLVTGDLTDVFAFRPPVNVMGRRSTALAAILKANS